MGGSGRVFDGFKMRYIGIGAQLRRFWFVHEGFYCSGRLYTLPAENGMSYNRIADFVVKHMYVTV